MNKWQEEVAESLLDSEESALDALAREYKQALNDINQQIKLFQSDIEMLDQAISNGGMNDQQTEILLSQRRSKVYQQQFQETLKGQIDGILEQLHSKEYNTIQNYLQDCYENSYIGEFYSLSQQGLPYIAPINQSAATHAILTDSKVVKGYYARLGVDINHLKDVISKDVTRGIASAASYAEIARNIDNDARTGLFNAQRIARTEGHRIQNTASRDAANNATQHGAELVKIWDATLDGKTRESHMMVDGEIRELDEPFSNGLDRPGDPSGEPEEVINCRCTEIHKPKWALDDGFIKMDNFSGNIREFNSPEDYNQFKEWYWSKENQQYMDYTSKMEEKYGTNDSNTLIDSMSYDERIKYNELVNKNPLFEDIEKLDLSGRIESLNSVVPDAIASGTVSKVVNPSKQNRHIKESTDYLAGRSYINGNLEYAQKLVDELSGTGSPIMPNGRWTNKERVESDSFIGVHVNPKTGKETATKKAIIIYSKTGTHIIPRKG